MDFFDVITRISNALWSFPVLIVLFIFGVLVFLGTYSAPLRYFFRAWKAVFSPEEAEVDGGQMSSVQALINTLGASIGNGTIAGIATAIASGGPGAIFWMFCVGFLSMAWRFAEVYLATYFIGKATFGGAKGGPFVYLSKVPGGSVLPYLYAVICFIFAVAAGGGMQSNSISTGLSHTWHISEYISATLIFAFIVYALLGNTQRIIRISDKLVPFKVVFFMIAATIVLIYHAPSLIPAISLIIKAAFTPSAVVGATLGLTIQTAMRFGIDRGITANEGGLGTSAIFFGATSGKNPIKDSMLAMLGVFITTHIIGLMVALPIIASGVWTSGQTGTPLTISAFETVYGHFGGWIVTFIAASFGLSVIVAYAFLALECWRFFTRGRGTKLFIVIYSAATFLGAISSVNSLWSVISIFNSLLLLINLFGIVWLLPIIRKGIAADIAKRK